MNLIFVLRMLITNDFVVGLTSSLWATIYRKRKAPGDNINEDFDLAADINQKPNFDQYDQDQVVKDHFRRMVDYIIQVIELIIENSRITNDFRGWNKVKNCC